MEWVSVKDELPKIERNVLVTDGKTIGIAWVGCDRKTKDLIWIGTHGDDIDGFEDKLNCLWHYILYVTHWAPLPKPPKKKLL